MTAYSDMDARMDEIIARHFGKGTRDEGRVKRPVEGVTVKVQANGHTVVWVTRLDRMRVYMAMVGSPRADGLLARGQWMQRTLLAKRPRQMRLAIGG